MKIMALSALLLGLFTLGACTLENQSVMISPQLTYKSEKIGHQQPIYLSVVDKRPSKLIGYRKDETKDQADITAANDVRTAVYNSIKQVFLEQGFVMASSPEASVAQFTLDIEDLTYKAGGAYVAPSLETRMLLKGTARRGTTTRSNNYEINRSGREAKPLTAERNAKMINDIVSQTLQMVAEDRAMMNFLATAPGQGL
ncbi:YajG family lipoprotein [Govanella unica]|uniref:YajG family lipoprotein n=1 Tax=Govanella unica TaxID=2975056 RepID=A0A9X3TYT1_9PROT|nr:YajG family lipoprotein [Govania unica]MDA5194108.1 YajG family lipoprotein [Govania unica]